jgi:hypothetical protein
MFKLLFRVKIISINYILIIMFLLELSLRSINIKVIQIFCGYTRIGLVIFDYVINSLLHKKHGAKTFIFNSSKKGSKIK